MDLKPAEELRYMCIDFALRRASSNDPAEIVAAASVYEEFILKGKKSE
jgi:hypothetical protein